MVVNNSSVNFTSRCPHIKDAQWVCHNVAANFPHISTTRLEPSISRLEDRYPDVYDEFLSIKPYSPVAFQDENSNKVMKIFCRMKQLIRELNSIRADRRAFDDTSFLFIRNILNRLKVYKLGNCYENAKLSELILRLNGKKNVYTAAINVGDRKIDHVVCFYNRDGSPFNGRISKDTIIVDSWLGEADFADNILVKYRNLYKDFLFVPAKGKLSFRNVTSLDLSENELIELAKDFPQLIKKKP